MFRTFCQRHHLSRCKLYTTKKLMAWHCVLKKPFLNWSIHCRVIGILNKMGTKLLKFPYVDTLLGLQKASRLAENQWLKRLKWLQCSCSHDQITVMVIVSLIAELSGHSYKQLTFLILIGYAYGYEFSSISAVF